MGGDIAAWCALRGLDVTLQDRELEVHRAGAGARARVVRPKLRDPAQRGRGGRRACAPTSPATACRSADVVIEAIFENLEAKRALYAASSRA